MHRFVPIYMLIKIFKKIIQFQPIKSYILWKLMTATITWPTDKLDKDKVDKEKVANEKVAKDKVDKDKVYKDKVDKDKVDKGKVDKDKVNKDKVEFLVPSRGPF